MKRTYFHRLSVLAVCGTLVAASLASAGDKKGLNAAARRSLGSSNSSSQGMKFSTSSAINVQRNNLSQNQSMSGNALSTRKSSFITTSNHNLANALKKGSLSPTSGKLQLNANGLNNIGTFTPRNNLVTDRARLADIVKKGGLKPIGGIGTGTGGIGTFPGKNVIVDRGRIADIIKDGGLKPIDDNPPVADPSNNPPANPPADPPANPPADPTPCPPKDDCHHHFPWWPIVVGGSYNWCHTSYPVYGGVTVVERPVVQTVVAAQPVQTAAAGTDLVVVDVRMVDAGDAQRKLGPRYRLFVTNRGLVAAGNFQAVIMATKDAQPDVNAPTASGEIAQLAAGETISVDLRLPLSADLTTLPVLIAAVDSVLQVAELDETNNALAVDRAKVSAAP
jgi:hypothetical protein